MPNDKYLPDFLTIPCVLIKDSRLQHLDHLVYGVIYWYSKMRLEKCVASNGTIAELLSSSSGSVANSISRLSKYGYVRVIFKEIPDSKNKVRIEIIPLIVFSDPSSKNEGGVHQKMKGGSSIDEGGVSFSDEHNNNILEKEKVSLGHIPTYPHTTEDSTQTSPAPYSNNLEAIQIAKRLFSLWLQHKILTQHKTLSERMQSRINARLREGYTELEMSCAIDNYALVLDSPDFFLNYRWSFDQFMEPRNLDKFIDIEAAKASYYKGNRGGGVASVG